MVQNVFVNSVQHRRTGVMTSARGLIETAANGDRFLVLLSGRRYEGTPGEAEFRVMEFERYATRVHTKEGDEPQATHKSLTTLALIENPSRANLGELLWRIGVPLSARKSMPSCIVCCPVNGSMRMPKLDALKFAPLTGRIVGVSFFFRACSNNCASSTPSMSVRFSISRDRLFRRSPNCYHEVRRTRRGAKGGAENDLAAAKQLQFPSCPL